VDDLPCHARLLLQSDHEAEDAADAVSRKRKNPKRAAPLIKNPDRL
jgi:hypothetical protein